MKHTHRWTFIKWIERYGCASIEHWKKLKCRCGRTKEVLT